MCWASGTEDPALTGFKQHMLLFLTEQGSHSGATEAASCQGPCGSPRLPLVLVPQSVYCSVRASQPRARPKDWPAPQLSLPEEQTLPRTTAPQMEEFHEHLICQKCVLSHT